MPVNAVNAKIKVLKDRYEALEADYISVNQQIIQTRDAAERNKLQRTADDLFQRMLGVEEQLNQSTLLLNQPISTETYKAHYNNWQEDFHKINFSNLDNILDYISKKVFTDRGGGVFFLLQNYYSMGGKWCVEKIKFSLKNKGVWHPPLNVVFQGWEMLNETEFFKRLGANLGIEVNSSNLAGSTQVIIDKIYSLLQTNSTVFIEVIINSNDNPKLFLDWMIPYFWMPLLDKLSLVNQKLPYVKFITVLSIGKPITKNCISSRMLCEKGKFNQRKILEIELSNWAEEEIR